MLEIALIINEKTLPAWQHRMLEQVQTSTFARVNAVFIMPPKPTNLPRCFGCAFLRLMNKVDSLLFTCFLSAREAQHFLPLLNGVPIFQMGDERDNNQPDLSGIKADVAIDLTGKSLGENILTWPRHGVWRHFFGNPVSISDDFLGVREFSEHQDEIISGLERIQPNNQPPQKLFYATTSTDPLSISRSVESVLWKMANAIPQRLQELKRVGAERFFLNAEIRLASLPVILTPEKRPVYWADLLVMTLRYPMNIANALYNMNFNPEQWILLTGKSGTVHEFGALESFQKQIPPRDRFWADPFVILHDGEHYIFFEELVYTEGIGHLSCFKLNPDGTHEDPIRILEQPYHLSYPFVFRYQESYYMIPETADNQTIELYRCEEFPHRWVFEKNLMNQVEAYDSTLLEYDGRWWLFTNMRKHVSCSSHESLYLFYADSPLSDTWVAHPHNPIETRSSHARPGGRIFLEEGKLYRPSQNCAGSYGRGLNLNQILQLDEQVYREATISQCLPEGQSDLNGMHTLDSCRGLVVSDALLVHKRLSMAEKAFHLLTKYLPDFQRGLFRKRYILLAACTAYLFVNH